MRRIEKETDNALIFKTKTGKFFVLASVDEFEAEMESLRNNTEFMAFLQKLSEEPAVISIEDLRTELTRTL